MEKQVEYRNTNDESSTDIPGYMFDEGYYTAVQELLNLYEYLTEVYITK